MQKFLEVAEQAARDAGDLLLRHQHQIVGREKGPRDLVSDADLASQRLIRRTLIEHFPDHDFLGEEDERTQATRRGAAYRWLVDPLDGTLNYLHRMPAFAVSIALEHGGQIVAGVVFDPVLKECFTASRGGGAQLNGIPLQTSRCARAESALVAASFAPVVPRDSYEIVRFVEALQVCQGIRRLGSAALNLAYVAAGRLDAYWATSVKIWDVAAGVLLVTEAGGQVTHIEGGPLDLEHPELLASASESLGRELTGILNPR